MIKVKMLANARGSENGYQVRVFEYGKIYRLDDELARVFVNDMKVAEEVRPARVIIEYPEEVKEVQKPKKRKYTRRKK